MLFQRLVDLASPRPLSKPRLLVTTNLNDSADHEANSASATVAALNAQTDAHASTDTHVTPIMICIVCS